MSSNRLTVRLDVGAPARAREAMGALAPDNGGFLAARVEGAVLVLDATGPSPRGLLRSLEDALDCLHAAGYP